MVSGRTTTAATYHSCAHITTLAIHDLSGERVGCGLGEGSGDGAQPPPQKFFLILDLKMAICGAFLVHFCSSAKTLRGRKDTLAQVYFYWGAIAPLAPPAGIDATENQPTVFKKNDATKYAIIRFR